MHSSRVAFAVMALVACSKTPEPSATTTATATTIATATATTTATASTTATTTTVAEIVWDAPASFASAASPSPMRKATYKFAKVAPDVDDAELSVTQVGGGVDANVDRWVSQFSEGKGSLKRTQKQVGKLKITMVELRGKFAGSGMPGAPAAGPKDGYALLGAIVEGVDPPYFFKMTGPEKTVVAARGDFDKLVGSVRPKP